MVVRSSNIFMKGGGLSVCQGLIYLWKAF